ncbi:MAG TPA: lipid II flippase MurJ [Acidimicrobiales bacterium]|nr:lipid II flippase MurJ [Acidimicrobiales bacterium]
MSAVATAPSTGAPAPASPDRLARSTAVISAMTLLSRVTGFGRVFVLAAVVGATYLGNTYQAANSVPNLVFELFAAGALQAVLVPELIEVSARRGRAAGRRVAGLVLGGLLAVFGVVVLAGAALAPLVARVLFAGASGEVADDQAWLGTVFLWVFLPQVLFYAGGLVATAVLNSEDRFAVPAAAPILNNLVVMGAYLGFWWLRGGEEPTLDLSAAEVAVLAGGTTLGVVVFTSAPVIAAVRAGLLGRPTVTLRDPDVRRLAGKGAWAGAFLGLIQVLLIVALALGNSVEGGGTVYQLGFTYFLLPHALVAVPVLTALYPSMSRAFQGGDGGGYLALVRSGVEATWVLVLPAVVALAVLAEPIARVTLFGEGASAVDAVAGTLVAFAPGLAPYGLFLLLTRATYARGDARRPTIVHLLAAGVGIAGMALAAGLLDGDDRITGLAAAHSAAYLVAAVVLGRALARDVGGRAVGRLAGGRVVAGAVLAAAASGAVMVAARLVGPDAGSRAGAVVQLVVGGGLGLAVYLAGLRLTGIGDPRRLLRPSVRAPDPADTGPGAGATAGPSAAVGAVGPVATEAAAAAAASPDGGPAPTRPRGTGATREDGGPAPTPPRGTGVTREDGDRG